MRVIAGSARRLLLEAPMEKVRPTTDRTKETLFNMINHDLPETRVLDLFAGSGALGIEALSRGAKICYFSDIYQKSIECIKNNLQHTKLIEKAKVFMYDYVKTLETLNRDGITLDIIFLDPPYHQELEMASLVKIIDLNLLSDTGTIIVESAVETHIDQERLQGYEIVKTKEYRTNKFTFIQKEVD